MREVLSMNMSLSNIQTRDPEMVKRLVHDRIRHAVADKIVGVTLTETQKEFHREYRCRVIVADYDDYWRDVYRIAQEMSLNPYPRFIEEGLK